MLESPKGPFVVLHFSYYTLMTLLMMLSEILLSMLMILFCILNVIGHLICGLQVKLASELESDLRETGLGQEVACCFQYWKNSTGFV